MTLTASDYVHLHNHTHHSLLDGLTKVDELFLRVKAVSYTHLDVYKRQILISLKV